MDSDKAKFFLDAQVPEHTNIVINELIFRSIRNRIAAQVAPVILQNELGNDFNGYSSFDRMVAAKSFDLADAFIAEMQERDKYLPEQFLRDYLKAQDNTRNFAMHLIKR